MKYVSLVLFLIVIDFLGFINRLEAVNGSATPLKYLSSCEIDIDNDGNSDIALLVETLAGREMIALLRTPTGYNAYVLSKNKPGMFLSCHFGKTLSESKALGENSKAFTTLGTFLKLTLPEGSSVAYFWNGNGFSEVWTAD